MSIKVTWRDGTVYQAPNSTAILEAMRLNPWEKPSASLDAYVSRVARRGQEFTGQPVSDASPKDLLSDLHRLGVARVEVTEESEGISQTATDL